MRTIFLGALWLMFFVAACGDADRTDGTTQYPDDSFILLPQEAYDFDESAPQIPGIGLLQGALVKHGEGRVAVFGEAAMFSAPIQEREAGPYPFGMNNPSAPHNARFLLNVVGWLTSTE